MSNVKIETLNIAGAPLEGENPLPFFRDINHNKNVGFCGSFPEEKKLKAGYEAGFRMLPYLRQDRFSRKRIPLQFKKIELENEYLKASFLPEMGGRLISLIDKTTKRELLSYNPVYQPTNIAIRNAWISGGIEWNIGQLGHTFHTSSSVFAALVKGSGDEEFFRIYEFERCKRLFWQIDFHLPSGSKILYAHTKIINPGISAVPMYWWTNIAVPETAEARVFASSDDVIYMDSESHERHMPVFGYNSMPELPSLPGKDASYPGNFNFSNEYFFQCGELKMPWEAVVYKAGELFFEISTTMLRYRKMFCWGRHKGGRHWQEFLSEPGNDYIELQAGLAPTQLHGLDMPGKAVWEWTQGFGGTHVDPRKAHLKDWNEAKRHIEKAVNGEIEEAELYAMDKLLKNDANTAPERLLHEGSGWGTLECERMAYEEDELIPSSLEFPVSALGGEQYPWLCLLQKGILPERDPAKLPGAWMVQNEWEQMLGKSLENEENRNWYALLHAGVMVFEKGDRNKAVDLWLESVKKSPSIWAYRNLMTAARISGDLVKAVYFMKKAWELPEKFIDMAFSQEYLDLLREAKFYEEAWEVFESLPENLQTNERVMLVMGFIAVELRKMGFAEKLFDYDFATIRENELSLSALWFKYHIQKTADERGLPADDKLAEEVEREFALPYKLNFESVDKPGSSE